MWENVGFRNFFIILFFLKLKQLCILPFKTKIKKKEKNKET